MLYPNLGPPSLQNWWEINVCGLSHMVYGILFIDSSPDWLSPPTKVVALLSVLCSNFVHNTYFEKLVFTAFKRKFITTVTVRADDLQNLLKCSIILISKIKYASIRSRHLFTKLLHRLLRNSQQTSRSFLPKSFWYFILIQAEVMLFPVFIGSVLPRVSVCEQRTARCEANTSCFSVCRVQLLS